MGNTIQYSNNGRNLTLVEYVHTTSSVHVELLLRNFTILPLVMSVVKLAAYTKIFVSIVDYINVESHLDAKMEERIDTLGNGILILDLIYQNEIKDAKSVLVNGH